MSVLSIGQVARQTGVSVETVRFYEKQRLLEPPQRTAAGYRQYPPETVRRVRFIQRAKDVGFTLREIGELLALRREPGTSCAEVKSRATRKMDLIDQRIRDLTEIRDALERMAAKCSGRGTLGECPILEELENEGT